MKQSTVIQCLIFFTVLIAGIGYADESQNVFGVWSTEGNSAQIEIAVCEQGVCGNFVWLNPDSLDVGETAESVKDTHNKDPQLAQRNLLGLTMLWGFKPASSGWKGGKIYDPESGKTYSSKIRRLDKENLQVKGCISLFCQSQTWKLVQPEK